LMRLLFTIIKRSVVHIVKIATSVDFHRLKENLKLFEVGCSRNTKDISHSQNPALELT
jgi:hypothetical protein